MGVLFPLKGGRMWTKSFSRVARPCSHLTRPCPHLTRSCSMKPEQTRPCLMPSTGVLNFHEFLKSFWIQKFALTRPCSVEHAHDAQPRQPSTSVPAFDTSVLAFWHVRARILAHLCSHLTCPCPHLDSSCQTAEGTFFFYDFLFRIFLGFNINSPFCIFRGEALFLVLEP